MREDLVALAVRITAQRRYVPFAVCLDCERQADNQHLIPHPSHRLVALTLEERDEVDRRHKAASDQDRASERGLAKDILPWTTPKT